MRKFIKIDSLWINTDHIMYVCLTNGVCTICMTQKNNYNITTAMDGRCHVLCAPGSSLIKIEKSRSIAMYNEAVNMLNQIGILPEVVADATINNGNETPAVQAVIMDDNSATAPTALTL